MVSFQILISSGNKQKFSLKFFEGSNVDFIIIPYLRLVVPQSSLPSLWSGWRVSSDFPTPIEHYCLAQTFKHSKLCANTEAVYFEVRFTLTRTTRIRSQQLEQQLP